MSDDDARPAGSGAEVEPRAGSASDDGSATDDTREREPAAADGGRSPSRSSWTKTRLGEGPATHAMGRRSLRSALRTSSLDLTGQTLGHYEIGALLGKGGVGMVYEAFDRHLERRVALKLLRTDDPESAERLLSEARAQARIDHEDVCRVYEAGDIDGHAYIAMQYIEGRPLGEVFPEMTLREKVEVVRRVALGLQSAHDLNLIHRDVKPSNILVDKTSRGTWKPVILDFGLAREQAAPGQTSTGEVKGTPSYMAPEQVTGQVHTLDARSDVYSLGATLYEGLAGHQLFCESSSGFEVMIKVLNEEPEPLRDVDPEIPVELESIVMRCLEKEPDRRYPSAQAVAEDLRRFLDGELVEARPVGVVTRTWRRLKRRPVAVLSAVLAVTVVVAVALLVASQWRAAARARHLDEYRRDVRYIDELVGDAYRAPVHDITPAKEQVRARLEDIASRLARQGPLAQAAGSFALGRGHLALHEYETAYRHLDRAWEQGYRDPEVGYALGRALGALYEKELQAARRIPDERQREDRLREIERRYREPALDRLRQSAGVEVDSVDLVEAHVAFWEGRYEEALAKAESAQRAVPWLYEALTLEGDVEVAVGAAHYQHGDYDAALAAYRRAQEAYAAAADKGRSDARVYEGQCNLGRELMVLAAYGLLTSPEPHFAYGRAACDRARAVDPERVEPHLLASILHWRMGESLTYAEVDPSGSFETAAAEARRALEMEPGNTEAWVSLGWSRSLLAQWQATHGADPRPAAEDAVEAFRTAVEIDPSFAQGYNGMGYTSYQLALWQLERGLDPRPRLDAAERDQRRAVELEPGYVYAYDTLGNVHEARARWRTLHGEDPSASVDAAVAAFARLRELNPNYIWGYVSEGDAWCSLASHRLDAGEDAEEPLARARAAYEAAAEIDPEEGWMRLGLGRVALLEARRQVARGGDPTASLAAARGDLEPLVAEQAGEARTAHPLAVEVALVEARWRLATGHPADATIARGLELARRDLEPSAGLAELTALEGALLLLRGHHRGDAEDLARGRTAVTEALDQNAHLVHRYGPLLAGA